MIRLRNRMRHFHCSTTHQPTTLPTRSQPTTTSNPNVPSISVYSLTHNARYALQLIILGLHSSRKIWRAVLCPQENDSQNLVFDANKLPLNMLRARGFYLVICVLHVREPRL